MTPKQMIEKFQCPGCVSGESNCNSYKIDNSYGNRCSNHVVGTMFNFRHYALGLPTGFNKSGFNDKRNGTKNTMMIRLWLKGTSPTWDHLNVPVWSMEENGFLFVRTYSPRIDDGAVDIIEGGVLEMVPNSINVAEFIDEID